jgi:ATP-dependent helicase/DNAse subunit B
LNIEHISVSRKGTWEECQLAYKYKYHLKLQPTRPEPFYFIYGKIIHTIAETYVGEKGKRRISDCAIDVLTKKIPIERGDKPVFAPKLPENYKKRMPQHIKAIKTITEQLGYDGKIEHPFNYDLDPPNNKFVKGFIDRLIQNGDNWFILDYKTTQKGKFRKDNNTIMHDLQLRMYARVVQKEFQVPAENIRCALYYLEDGDLVAAKYNDDAIISAEQELLEAYNQIFETAPEAALANTGDHCFRCLYRDRCPYFNMI